MPVYEYVCQKCAHPFEELVRGDEKVACPKCSTTRVQKKFSTFATSGDAASASDDAGGVMADGGGCGTCGDPRGPGSCSTN
jgi:putative FmdB family regulatory protein